MKNDSQNSRRKFLHQMRTHFIKQLLVEAESDSKIVLLTGDLGYGVVEPFAEKFPNRFFNVSNISFLLI